MTTKSQASAGIRPSSTIEQAKKDLDAHGVAVLTGVLTADEAADVRSLVVDAAEASEKQGVKTSGYDFDTDDLNRRVFMLFNHNPRFAELVQHPTAVEFVRHGLGESYLVSNFSANITRPGSAAMRLHADQQFALPPWPNKPLGINVGWILDDFTEDVGATRYVPGSHLIGHAPDSQPETVPLEAPAGSILVMDGRLWHCTGPNVTKDRERAALFGWYVRPWIRPQINWNFALDPAVVDGFSSEFVNRLGLRSGNSTVH